MIEGLPKERSGSNQSPFRLSQGYDGADIRMQNKEPVLKPEIIVIACLLVVVFLIINW